MACELYLNKAVFENKFQALKPQTWKYDILGGSGAPFETELRYAENSFPILLQKFRDNPSKYASLPVNQSTCLQGYAPYDHAP